MNNPCDSKFLQDALIDVVTAGLNAKLWNEAETVTQALKAVQPTKQKLALFDAMIAMGREQWLLALDHLVPLVAAFPEMEFCWSLMMKCMFSRGDLGWREVAQEIIERDPGSEAAVTARQMLHGIEESVSGGDGIPTDEVFEIFTHRFLLRAPGTDANTSESHWFQSYAFSRI